MARLKLTPRAMPLRADALEPVLHALYSVYSGRRKGEVIAPQVVLGRGYRPAQLPAKILDPAPSFGQLLLRGTSPAPSEIRSRIAKQIGVARVEVTVRIGVTAALQERGGRHSQGAAGGLLHPRSRLPSTRRSHARRRTH